jgi:hypothetical protein
MKLTATMSVETVNHLTSIGVSNIEKAEHTLKDLDASKLTIELTKSPRTVPELNSKETWSWYVFPHTKYLIVSGVKEPENTTFGFPFPAPLFLKHMSVHILTRWTAEHAQIIVRIQRRPNITKRGLLLM